MSEREVRIRDATFYGVGEVRIEHDADHDSLIYISLHPKRAPGVGHRYMGTTLTVFAPHDDDDDPPAVYIDGKLIEPVYPEKEPEET